MEMTPRVRCSECGEPVGHIPECSASPPSTLLSHDPDNAECFLVQTDYDAYAWCTCPEPAAGVPVQEHPQ